MTKEFETLGLKVEHFPFAMARDWRPTDFSANYTTADGKTIDLPTVFPVSGTKATGPEGITADAVWVGIGSGADFIGRDVKGKAVIIYSTFVPGGRSHSASDRAGLFDSNTRAAKLGAAAIIDIMAVPGNGQFEPEGGCAEVPNSRRARMRASRCATGSTRARRSRCTSNSMYPSHQVANRIHDRHAAWRVRRADRRHDAHGRLLPGGDGQRGGHGERARNRPLLRREAAGAAAAHDAVHPVPGSSPRRSGPRQVHR